MIQRWDDLTEAEQKRVLLVQNLDDEDMTYLMDYAQYAQVGNCHNLGDEVRELRKKVEMQQRSIDYWRNSYDALAYAVVLVLGLYGWGSSVQYIDGLAHVRKDIEALRQRIRELKGREKADGELIAPIREAFDLWEKDNLYPMVPIEIWVQHVLLPTWEKGK